ncbi:MAG TPA: dTDP-glucose 4,6-dehydratase [Candidatus Fermentibacter daniensis]|nr:dTDP-glucose 4,6-dehydratase [Candidatus Fermentibacter daniensis]HOR07740.1 dTDP-glucose 4,6-dehydratase [Candidatus Fermentibacter daniensis]HPK52143.1 dTDP-glucose 4,6-dehydratase [Candidatus Fermentibacter daniensis]
MRILVTGGAGFIGSNFVRMLASERPGWSIRVLDKLTYAGRRDNLADLESSGRLEFRVGDICDPAASGSAVDGCDVVVNFAAETHVDRSIDDPAAFVRTDVEGVRTLLEAFRASGGRLFLQISTDEVYGSVETGRSSEDDPLAPRSPYSASKAGGELLAMSFFHTWGVPVVVTRASNNYGPYQYPEKLVPLFVTNCFEGLPLPLYGDGLNRRDWLYVEDHCRALLAVVERATPGRIYNIGAGEEHTNLEVTGTILELTGADRSLVRMIDDRPGHDRRYALDISRISSDLGWSPSIRFEEGMARTVEWYRSNRAWWEEIKSGRFREYYMAMYADRLAAGKSVEAGL